MKVYAFALPDKYDDKELAKCTFNMRFSGNEGVLTVSMIDDSGKFTREETAKVRELGVFSHKKHSL